VCFGAINEEEATLVMTQLSHPANYIVHIGKRKLGSRDLDRPRSGWNAIVCELWE
jgi:hypothetical protein